MRAAQGRDEEAEELFHEAWPQSPTRTSATIEHEVLGPYVQFLRDRERDDEAERLEERLAELLPAAENSSARIA